MMQHHHRSWSPRGSGEPCTFGGKICVVSNELRPQLRSKHRLPMNPQGNLVIGWLVVMFGTVLNGSLPSSMNLNKITVKSRQMRKK